MKCKWKETCGYDICMDECCPEFEGVPLTNADRIRAMSDEELATLFECFSACAICEEAKRLDDNPFLKDEKCDEDCEAHILKWLKQPVEGEHG